MQQPDAMSWQNCGLLSVQPGGGGVIESWIPYASDPVANSKDPLRVWVNYGNRGDGGNRTTHLRTEGGWGELPHAH